MIQTQRHQYPNGLTLLLVETHQAPVVSINICVRVGSRYEADHEAGLCHLLEHMLFKGTKKLKPGEVAKIIEAHGGDVNAYTSFDETVYYCTLSSRHAERGLEVLSDAVLNSLIDPEELDREREVVLEEILRGKDNPNKVLSEALFEKSYRHHRYGRPIIGFAETVRGFPQKKVYDFYRRWYVPENIVVVLAGDFQSATIRKQCDRIFGTLKKSPSPKEKIIFEKPQKRTQTLILKKPVSGTSVAMAFHAPQLDHEDIPALDVLSHLLGEGESSRLDMEVKERLGLVTSIYSYVYTPQHPGLFMIGYSLQEKNLARAGKAVFEQIHKLHYDKVSHEEMTRAKLNIRSDSVYEKETVEGLARKVGYFETILKQHNFDNQYYQRIDNVTPDDVRKVAQRYLTPENLTLGLLYPERSKKTWKSNQVLEWVRPLQKTKRILKKKPEGVRYVTLKNGFRILLKENPNVPIVALRSAHLAGLRNESLQTNGIHSLLSQVWGKSSKSYSATEMARQIEDIAGSIDSYTGKNLTGMKADFLSEKLREGMDLFLEAYLEPRFDSGEIERERENLLEALRREEDALANQAFKQFTAQLYPKHPYGLPLLGNAKNLRSFRDQDLKKTFHQVLDPSRSVLAVVGDFDGDQLLEILQAKLEALPKNTHRFSPPQADPAPNAVRRIEKQMDRFQAHLVYGFRGLSFHDPDRYALDVLNNVLAGQGGRLFLELRDKLSLAYSVTSLSQEGIEPGYFGVYIATEGSKVETALAGIENELKKVLTGKISKAEIDRAKQYLVGAYEIDLQRGGTVATQLAFNEIYGMDRREWLDLPKKILKVTPVQVQAVAQKILKLDQAVISIIRPRGDKKTKSPKK